MPILTATQGTNADLLSKVFELYVKLGDVIADVTYGKGVFWRNIDKSKYTVLESDLAGDPSIDFRDLPHQDASVDVLILDPPYIHSDSGKTLKASIADCYGNNDHRNGIGSHTGVVRIYAGGILEATRVLKRGGKALIKCQDEIESSRQKWLHEELGDRSDLCVLICLS